MSSGERDSRVEEEGFGWLAKNNDWHEHAKCSSYPQEWFFGEEQREGKRRHRPTLTSIEVRRAKAICAVCPVLQECYDYAMAADEEYGVWGGTTRRDRHRIRERPIHVSQFGTSSLSSH